MLEAEICKSTETENKNMQIKCYATELGAMVTRCLNKRKCQVLTV